MSHDREWFSDLIQAHSLGKFSMWDWWGIPRMCRFLLVGVINFVGKDDRHNAHVWEFYSTWNTGRSDWFIDTCVWKTLFKAGWASTRCRCAVWFSLGVSYLVIWPFQAILVLRPPTMATCAHTYTPTPLQEQYVTQGQFFDWVWISNFPSLRKITRARLKS